MYCLSDGLGDFSEENDVSLLLQTRWNIMSIKIY
jgi:hypothetical protein